MSASPEIVGEALLGRILLSDTSSPRLHSLKVFFEAQASSGDPRPDFDHALRMVDAELERRSAGRLAVAA